MSSTLKTIFFGTPGVAVPFLEQLHAATSVQLVITQPDKPAGRGLSVQQSPVKTRAKELGLSVVSPQNLSEAAPQIAAAGADLGLAVAYGKIFRQDTLGAFKYGIINIHFSLLPAYRGAAPVQRALFDGATQSGVTAFWIDAGLDTGPIAAAQTVPIADDDDAATLFPKLITAGQQTLAGVLADVAAGHITKAPQQGAPTLAPMISKQETILNFAQMDAQTIHNRVRGLAAAMPAHAKAQTPGGALVQILKTQKVEQKCGPGNPPYKPGQFIGIERGLGFLVQCNGGILLIKSLRPAGKKTMPAGDYTNGAKLASGDNIFT